MQEVLAMTALQEPTSWQVSNPLILPATQTMYRQGRLLLGLPAMGTPHDGVDIRDAVWSALEHRVANSASTYTDILSTGLVVAQSLYRSVYAGELTEEGGHLRPAGQEARDSSLRRYGSTDPGAAGGRSSRLVRCPLLGGGAEGCYSSLSGSDGGRGSRQEHHASERHTTAGQFHHAALPTAYVPQSERCNNVQLYP